jgi:hypothetical protein
MVHPHRTIRAELIAKERASAVFVCGVGLLPALL